MAEMTITIDAEAYDRLRQMQKPGESISQTIKRVIRPPLDLDAWLEDMKQHPFSRDAVQAIEQQIASRDVPSSRKPPYGLP